MRGVSPALSWWSDYSLLGEPGTDVTESSVTLSAGCWRWRAPETGGGRLAADRDAFLTGFVGVMVVRCLTFLPSLASFAARRFEDRRVTCDQSGVWSITASESVSPEDPSSILSES